MSKKDSTATATETQTDATATEKIRATPGSSITSQAKQLVISLSNEINGQIGLTPENTITVTIGADSAEWLHNLAGQIATTQTRGINQPLSVQLETTEAQRNAILVGGSVVDGKFQYATTEDADNFISLTNRIERIKRDMKKAAQTPDAGTAATDEYKGE